MIFTGLARIGRDVELRFNQGGDPVAGLALAYNYGRKGDDGKQPTQWIEASLWGKLAEALAPYLLKGKQVDVVVEDLHVETYQTRDGGTGTKLVGRILKIELAGSRDAAAPAAAPAQRPAAAPAPRPAAAPKAAGADDEVPF